MIVPREPRIFIASSREGLPVANLIKDTLFDIYGEADCYIWDDPGVFEVSGVIIDSLQKALELFSYAIIVLTPDDRTSIRGTQYAAPRDNLIYELGLFTGRYGRDHVFMVVPQDPKIRLPSDLGGVITCKYKVRPDSTMRPYDVRTSCNQIMQAIKKIEIKKTPEISCHSDRSMFWDNLSDIILIVFGADYYGDGFKNSHTSISLRDLKAAQYILEFLARRYPEKQLITVSASTTGWQNLLHTKADLIIIGGFVSNIEFRRHQSSHQQNFRLKMGRLCRMKGQHVYHVDFDYLLPGQSGPPRDKPLDIELFPSGYVSRDFGLVYSVRGHLYGSDRMIISIAGIKGNGTLGAAIHLTKTDTLNSFLQNPINKDDLLEIIIKSDVNNDMVSRTEIVEVMLNGISLCDCDYSSQWGEPCELNRECKGCNFGETISDRQSISD